MTLHVPVEDCPAIPGVCKYAQYENMAQTAADRRTARSTWKHTDTLFSNVYFLFCGGCHFINTTFNILDSKNWNRIKQTSTYKHKYIDIYTHI